MCKLIEIICVWNLHVLNVKTSAWKQTVNIFLVIALNNKDGENLLACGNSAFSKYSVLLCIRC